MLQRDAKIVSSNARSGCLHRFPQARLKMSCVAASNDARHPGQGQMKWVKNELGGATCIPKRSQKQIYHILFANFTTKTRLMREVHTFNPQIHALENHCGSWWLAGVHTRLILLTQCRPRIPKSRHCLSLEIFDNIMTHYNITNLDFLK